jgi:hypothetical protein
MSPPTNPARLDHVILHCNNNHRNLARFSSARRTKRAVHCGETDFDDCPTFGRLISVRIAAEPHVSAHPFINHLSPFIKLFH